MLVRVLPRTIAYAGIAVHTGIIDASARTATMSHRGGPNRINVTSLRFGSTGRWCRS